MLVAALRWISDSIETRQNVCGRRDFASDCFAPAKTFFSGREKLVSSALKLPGSSCELALASVLTALDLGARSY